MVILMLWMGSLTANQVDREKIQTISSEEFKARDKNSDGQLSAAEYGEHSQPSFVMLDKNEDGFLSVKELAQEIQPQPR